MPQQLEGKTLGTVLHVVSDFDYGGVESRMSLIFEGSDSSNFRHHFCVIRSSGRVAQRIQGSGGTVIVLGCEAKIPSVLALVRLVKLFLSLRPTVVHSHGAEANFHAIIAATICGVPARFAEEIGIPNHSRFTRLVFRLVYGFASGISAVSPATRSRVLELREAKEGKVRAFVSPARLSSYVNRSSPSVGKVMLGFIGRLEKNKNPISLVDAVHYLREKGVGAELTIIGEGSLKEDLQARIRDLELSEFVSLLGYSENPVSRMGAVNLLVQPSESEGLSMALVEAMSAGIPPLISPIGGGADLVVEGVTGWILDAVDPMSICLKIQRILKMSPRSFQKVGVAASSLVHSKFDHLRYVGELEDLYMEFLPRSGIGLRGVVKR